MIYLYYIIKLNIIVPVVSTEVSIHARNKQVASVVRHQLLNNNRCAAYNSLFYAKAGPRAGLKIKAGYYDNGSCGSIVAILLLI